MPEPRKLKGVNFRGTIAALERNKGKELTQRVVARVPGEAGEAIRTGAIVAGGWYAGAWYGALLAAIDAETGGGPAFAKQLSREAVKNDMETIFKILSLFVSPQFALQNGVKVIKRYVDGGTLEVLSAQQGDVRFRFTEYYGYTHLMWCDFIGGMEGVLDAMHLAEVGSRIHSGGRDGDPDMEASALWKP